MTERLHFHALEKEMASHSSVLAWRIPGMGEPGRLLSMASHRVGHDWSDLVAAAAGFPGGSDIKEYTCQCRRGKRLGFDPWVRNIPWRRKWQPTPVLLPGESQGRGSLLGCRLWGRTGSHRVGHDWSDLAAAAAAASSVGTIPNWQLFPSPQVCPQDSQVGVLFCFLKGKKKEI